MNISCKEPVVPLTKIVSDVQPQTCPALTITFVTRFSGNLYIKNMSIQLFEMEPSGIYEFTSHPFQNDLSTMPVIFSEFDSSGVPHLLKAVWQPNEIFEFGRGMSRGACLPTSGVGQTLDRMAKEQLVICFVYVVIFGKS